MKKVLLGTTSALVLLGGAVAFAGSGNEAELDQTGADNTALFDQSAGNDNDITLIQTGDRNAADVTQSGDENEAGRIIPAREMRQTGNDNAITIDQSGDRNDVGTRGDGVDQIGDQNELGVTQTSNGNRVFEVQQTGTAGAAATQNSATVLQEGDRQNVVRDIVQTNPDAGGAANTVDITQSGERNILGVRSGPGTDAILQSGSGNSIVVTQDGNGNGSDGVFSGSSWDSGVFSTVPALGVGIDQGAVRQIGDDNSANVTQNGDTNLMGIAQDGNGNMTTLTQTGDDNEAAVSHTFDGNMSSVSQTGERNATGVILVGDGNTGDVTQDGDDNAATEDALGDGNSLTTMQDGNSNVSDIIVTGNANMVDVDQGPTPPFLFIPPLGGNLNLSFVGIIGDTNDVTVAQDYNFNDSFVSIAGSTNTVVVTQTGILSFGNISTVDIVGEAGPGGDENNVDVLQTGANESDIGIDGDRNVLSVDQLGRNFSTVSIDGDSEGDDNTVTVEQNNALSSLIGAENDSDVTIFGDNNDVNVNQRGNNLSLVNIDGGPEGDGNIVDVDQAGINLSDIDITGSGNDVGVDQDGLFGIGLIIAFVDIDGNGAAGDNNVVDITQFGANDTTLTIFGDRNDVTITQDGINSATVDIGGLPEGDDNLLNIDQLGGLGGLNIITVSISGDDNNIAGSSFGGDALTIAGGASLAPGDMFQAGSNNLIDLTVGDPGLESNANVFAFNQVGSNNTIIGSITGGDSNQAVVSQVGSGNLTNFAQVGGFNNLGVAQ